MDNNYGTFENPNNRATFAKNIVAVTSGKGGVGKSTVSVNFSVALAQKGYKVGLLDADVYGPDVPRMLGIINEKLRWGDNDKMIPHENFGVKVMSVGLTTPNDDTPLVWRGSVATSALIQFIDDVDWGELDFLVIDMPPGTGDVQLTMAQEMKITSSLVVTTPQTVAGDDVSRAIRMLKESGVPIGGIVENMSYFIAPDTKTRYNIFGSGAGKEMARRYNVDLLAQIPLDTEIREKSDSGRPAVATGRPEIKEQYVKIAEKIIEKLEGI